jgi:minor histocompatibility antigen H13
VFSSPLNRNLNTTKFVEANQNQLRVLLIYTYGIGAVFAIAYAIKRTWIFNNILGIAFCLFGLENLYFGKFIYAFLMLGIFFVYDIFFVFGTPIMVTLAKGIEGPIKLIFPRPDDTREAMLGLGDILVPGILVAMCLRFDMFLYLEKEIKNTGKKTIEVLPSTPHKFDKPYFRSSMLGYIVGIVMTLVALAIMETGQPALLYLVPCTFLGILIQGVIRGDIKKIWSWDE